MTQDHENFDRLRRLLALKRHEQPPPGYFYHFSQQVVLRIKDGETGERASLFERWFGDSPWFTRLFGSFQARPALGGLVGIATCGLVLAGILYSQPEQSPMVVTGMPLSVLELGASRSPAAYPQRLPFANISSTNGIVPRTLRDSLFEQVRPVRPQLVDFQGSLAPAAY